MQKRKLTQESRYEITFRKQTSKKHKTWEDDGILSVRDNKWFLLDSNGKTMACTLPLGSLQTNSIHIVKNIEFQIVQNVQNVSGSDKLVSNTHSNVSITHKNTHKTVSSTNKNVSGSDKNQNFYRIMHRKQTLKKHKTWEDDGFLIINSNNHSTIINANSLCLLKSKYSIKGGIQNGSIHSLGNIEIQVRNLDLDYRGNFPACLSI